MRTGLTLARLKFCLSHWPCLTPWTMWHTSDFRSSWIVIFSI